MDVLTIAQNVLGRAVSDGAMDMLTGDLNKRLRVREMEVVHTVAAAASVALPPDFAEAVLVELDDKPLLPVTLANLADGTFAIIGDQIRTTAPSGSLRLTYRARLEPFQMGQTNDAAEAHPNVYLYGLLMHHAALSRDDAGRQHWQGEFERALADAHEADTRARQSEIAMRPIPRYCA